MGIISSKPRQNLIINGDMQISQRVGTTSITSITSSAYMTDRFQYQKSGTMVHNAQQIGDAPSDSQSGQQFLNSLNLALTTPDTSIAAGDVCLIQQKIEGYIFNQIARQRTFTLSFWVKAVLPGTYCVAFQNSGFDRSYVAEYTINLAGTWEYKTITVNTPTPSAGTWNYTNGLGLAVVWTIAAGTNYQTTAGSWQTGNFIATSNQINGVNTGATDFRLTGVMLNEGNSPQPFRTFANNIQEELATCQRYYEKSYNINTVPGTANQVGAIMIPPYTPSNDVSTYDVQFKVNKRAAPSGRLYAFDGTADRVDIVDTGLKTTVNTVIGSVSESSFRGWSASGTGNGPSVYRTSFHFTVDAEL